MKKLENIFKSSVYVLCAGLVTQDTIDQVTFQLKVAYNAYVPNIKRYLKRDKPKEYC